MANQDRIFSTELNGYKKKQVEAYLLEVQANYEMREKELADKNEEAENLSLELAQNKGKLAALEETVKKLTNENAGLKEDLASAVQSISEKNKENEELRAKAQNVSEEYQRIARVLVDAEKKAEEIKSEAVADGEKEKARLNIECDDIRTNIHGMLTDVGDIEATSRESVRELFLLFEEQLKDFENSIKAKIDASSLAMNNFVAEKLAKVETVSEEPVEETNYTIEEPTESIEETAEDIEEDVLVEDYSFALSDEAEAFFKENNDG